jgi:hypothetical protein
MLINQRISGISYRLADGRSGEIIDPFALRAFYTRIFYADKIKNKKRPRQAPKAQG